MSVEPVAGMPSPRRPMELVGVSAELADARTRLRQASPTGHWDAVLAEVSRLQYEERLSPLAALQAVHAKLASGWVPRTTR
jgi:hypothetical protein